MNKKITLVDNSRENHNINIGALGMRGSSWSPIRRMLCEKDTHLGKQGHLAGEANFNGLQCFGCKCVLAHDARLASFCSKSQQRRFVVKYFCMDRNEVVALSNREYD